MAQNQIPLSISSCLDPRIGKLNSGRYYCFPNGYDKPELTGNLQQVQMALGIYSAKRNSEPKPLVRSKNRYYLVSVQPKVVTYAGSSTFGEYTVEVLARSHAEAIKIVRNERRETEGRFGVPATYNARLMP
jgi:hypothetical protein